MTERPPHGAPDADTDLTRTQEPSVSEASTIGPYRLLQKLGEGGMGEVWLAEQQRPVHRQVAVKVIKAGMDTAQVIARFEAERQALALMDHPAIAKVFDAGSTPQGRPYFVLELVRGESIAAYCDRHRLSIAERLDLFVQVCDGVQHAHQKGIIHRDLKPSNVLVTLLDDRPVPKIIDFGIAKATTQPLTERTLFTELGVLVGTPEYMSPEQAESTGLDIDTRTDVYALGVLLYELLTGTLPFDSKELREKGLEHIRRTIRERDPLRPSTRITQLGLASMEVADRRSTAIAKLAGQLRGDLDWITMRALEKDRTHRYQTANAFAMDIRRFLRDEPVSAGPPGAAYRVRKFVRRHRFGVATASAFTLLLIGVAVALALQAARVTRERDRASQEAETARRMSAFLVGLFQVADPSEARGNSVTAREILDKGAAKIEQELKGQPEIQGRLMATMGSVFQSLGLYKESASVLQKSLDVRRRALGERHPDVSASLQQLGITLVRSGDFAGAEAALREALTLREALFGVSSPPVAETVRGLGEVAYSKGDPALAESFFDRALQAYRGLGPSQDEAVADCLNDLAMAIERGKGDYAGSKTLSYEALQIRRRVLPEDHPKIAQSLNNVAMAHYRLRELDAAEPLFRESLALNRKLFGQEHPEVSTGLNNLALLQRERGNYAAASEMFAQVIDMDRRLLGPTHPFVANGLTNRAETVRRGGDPKGAEALLLESLGILGRTYPLNHWQIANTRTILARCLAEQHRFVEAEKLFVEAFSILEQQFGRGHPRVATAAERGAAIYDAWRKPDKATEWRKKATK